jgi:hypothetical protein
MLSNSAETGISRRQVHPPSHGYLKIWIALFYKPEQQSDQPDDRASFDIPMNSHGSFVFPGNFVPFSL